MAAVLRAEDFQAPDDPARVLAERREGKIASAIAVALGSMRRALDETDLEKLITQGDVQGVVHALTAPRVTDLLKAAYQPVADTFIDAATAEAAQKFGGLVTYDPIFAAGQLAGQQQTFIGSVLGPTAQIVRDQLIAGLRDGTDPEDVADTLRAVIGLTPRQAQAVSNFRRLLTEGDRQALARALRDKRYDATVESWVSGRAPVDEAKVDTMVERYAERSIANRANTIARTESVKATTGGIRDAYVQAVENQRLRASEVTRKWRLVPDEKLCLICASIPLLNPKGVGVLEPYASIIGPIMAPTVHPNCRCSEEYVADLSRVTVNPFSR